MDYTTLVRQIEPMDQAEPIDALSLYAAFQQLPDGRKKRGVRYPLALLLTLIVAREIDWGSEHEWRSRWGAVASGVAG
jgi:hypothetical protein